MIALALYGAFGVFYATSRKFPQASLFFVNLVAGALLVLNTIYFIKTLLKPAPKESDKDDTEIERDVNPNRVMIVIGLNLLFIFILIPLVGFYIASIVISFCLMYFLSLRRFTYLFLVPAMLPLTIYIVFDLLLHIPLSRI